VQICIYFFLVSGILKRVNSSVGAFDPADGREPVFSVNPQRNQAPERDSRKAVATQGQAGKFICPGKIFFTCASRAEDYSSL
jgi:hypothetical protein